MYLDLWLVSIIFISLLFKLHLLLKFKVLSTDTMHTLKKLLADYRDYLRQNYTHKNLEYSGWELSMLSSDHFMLFFLVGRLFVELHDMLHDDFLLVKDIVTLGSFRVFAAIEIDVIVEIYVLIKALTLVFLKLSSAALPPEVTGTRNNPQIIIWICERINLLANSVYKEAQFSPSDSTIGRICRMCQLRLSTRHLVRMDRQ